MQCIFSIDVEGWFHVLDVAEAPKPSEWHDQESRVEYNFLQLLDILSEHNVRSTCFSADGGFLALWRKFRYKTKCDQFLYYKEGIQKLLHEKHRNNSEIVELSRDYYLTINRMKRGTHCVKFT